MFASSQYWYESYGMSCPNRSDHGMSCNSAGYMGSQVMRGKAGKERHVVSAQAAQGCVLMYVGRADGL